MNCEHSFKLENTQYQFPTGISGTAQAVEYAYLMCIKCFKVVKKEIESLVPSGKE